VKSILDSEPLLRVEHLTKYFPVGHSLNPFAHRRQQIHAVDDVSFELYQGETLALVGESGCGKTTTARLLIRLYKPTSGSVYLDGRDIFKLRGKELKKMKQRIQMIFQDPYSSLSPRRTAGQTIGEPLAIHGGYSRQERKAAVIEMLKLVGLRPEHYNRFPHEFSGGQRQRIGIARALILQPSVLIADEPVSALDISIRAQILNLMQDLQKKYNLTYVFVAHDLSLVRYIATRVAIMYMGEIVEMTTAQQFYRNPLHPYTKVLLSAIPVPDPDAPKQIMRISGEVPNPASPPSGCRFHTRCPYAFERCRREKPLLMEVESGHFASCHLLDSSLPSNENRNLLTSTEIAKKAT
jgi:oligopeptide transport system ATP-binding protein